MFAALYVVKATILPLTAIRNSLAGLICTSAAFTQRREHCLGIGLECPA